MKLDEVGVTETIKDFILRKGVIKNNRYGRATSLTWSGNRIKYGFIKPEQINSGYITSINDRKVSKTATPEQLMAYMNSPDTNNNGLIKETYPTRFCLSKRCMAASWHFVDFERQGHSTCTKCGTVNKISQENIKLYLNDDGVSNKSNWEITPGMDHNDTTLRNKKGNALVIRPKSHLRNFWRIKKKIDEIANEWHFMAMDSIIKSAKAKLRRFYYSIHDGSVSDNNIKLPHGGAALAAACFYVAVLEFEHRVKHKTACTLPAIQESAQSVRDCKTNRQTRDVTEIKILKYAKRLQRHGLCGVTVPEIGAQTLQFKPQSASLQHARMAIFNKCHPTRIFLPIDKSWGIRIGDTKQGILYVESVKSSGEAFSAGIRKGDYICQLDKELIDIDFTPKKFETFVKSTKQKQSKKQIVEITIMRKKKN